MPSAPTALPQIWGVAVDGATISALDRRYGRSLRANRMTLVAAPGALNHRQKARLAALARRWRVPVFAPLRPGEAASCLESKRTNPGSRCGLSAGSAHEAAALAAGAAADVVLVRARNLSAFRKLAGGAAGGGRIAGVLRLSRRGYRAQTWKRAISVAGRSPRLDLVVRPVGAGRGAALARFLRQFRALRRGTDRKAPSAPVGVIAGATGPDSVGLSWRPARDNRRVTSYGLYRDGALVGSTTAGSLSFGRLTCASHLFEVDAVDGAGNRSAKADATSAPAGCDRLLSSPLPSGTQPPDEPTPPPADATNANLWVDANGGSCTDSATKVTYHDGAACRSIDAAADTCEAGDNVIVKGGGYASQLINGGNGRTSKCFITIAAGETATINGPIDFENAQQVGVNGGGGRNGVGARLRTARMGSSNSMVPNNQFAGNVSDGSRNVTLEGADFGGWLISDSLNVTVHNNDIGPCNSFDGQDPDAGGKAYCDNGSIEYCEQTEISCTGYNEGHLIEGNLIHDFGCDDSFFNGQGSDDCHWECMYVSYASNMTVRGNVFRNCANGGNIFHTFSNGGGSFSADFGFRNYTVENNVFEQSCNNSSAPCGGRLDGASGFGHCDIYGGGADLTNVKIRFNTFVGGSTFNLDIPCTQASGNGLQMIGNLMKRTSASCGIDWDPELATHNIYSGSGTCGSNAANVGADLSTVIVNDDNGGDQRLRGSPGSTKADGFVPVTVRGGCPTTDIEGQRRPTSGSCDAGADER